MMLTLGDFSSDVCDQNFLPLACCDRWMLVTLTYHDQKYWLVVCVLQGDFLLPGCGALVPGCEFLVPGCDVLVPGCEFLVPGYETLVPGCEFLVPGCDVLVSGCDVQVLVTEQPIVEMGVVHEVYQQMHGFVLDLSIV